MSKLQIKKKLQCAVLCLEDATMKCMLFDFFYDK